MEERLQITEANYKGYSKYKDALDNWLYKVIRNIAITGSIGVITTIIGIILAFLTDFGGLIFLGLSISIFSPSYIFFSSREMKRILKEYPDIDKNVDYHELERELVEYRKKNNIGNYSQQINKELSMDKEQKEYINKCNLVMEDVIAENKYKTIEVPPYVDKDELEKAKIKIKKLNIK